MKKNVLIMTLVVLIAGISLVSAEEMKGDIKGNMMGDSKKAMMGEGMMGGKGMMGMMGMHGMMMKMMEKLVVATSDGGIVVVSATKLSKYDKDLNLVKEVDLKNDMEGMQKMMSDMMEKCSMMKGMMGDMRGDSSKSTTGESTPADEHSSHHPENK